MNDMRSMLSVIAGCAVGLVAHLSAQEGHISQPLVSAGSVYVWNSDQQSRVLFRITGNKCNPPIDTVLNPDSYDTYRCADSEWFLIWVSTTMPNGLVRTLHYRLIAGHRYLLFQNEAMAGAWDVSEMNSR